MKRKRILSSTVYYILNSLLSLCLEDVPCAQKRFGRISVCVREMRMIDKLKYIYKYTLYIYAERERKTGSQWVNAGRFLIDRSEQHPEGKREDKKRWGDDIKWGGHALNSYICCLHFSQINMAPRFRKRSLTLPSTKSLSSPSFLLNPVFPSPSTFGLYIPAGAPKYLFLAHKCAFRAGWTWILIQLVKTNLIKKRPTLQQEKTHIWISHWKIIQSEIYCFYYKLNV